MNCWTVHVKNFGKIEEASVEVAPLTLFVGDNNSGKSYMMTLIYGLLTMDFLLDDYEIDEDGDTYKHCCEIVKKMIAQENEHEYCLSLDQVRLFENLINEIIESNKDSFLLRLFNKEMSAQKIEITFLDNCQMKFYISNYGYKPNLKKISVCPMKRGHEQDVVGYGARTDNFTEDGGGYSFFIKYIMQSMLQGGIFDRQNRKCIYLPSARTGFMLTYKTLIGNAMKEKFTLKKTCKNLLTKPTSDFLGELSSMDTSMEIRDYCNVYEFMEKRVIDGRIDVPGALTQDFLYTPVGEEQSLPLYVTSGVVTEMTPLILVLKYVDLTTLLIEEPEISLHPQLQWQIARVLIRLSNMGLPVFVTTHSDLILQHVNNMIKANEMKDKEAFLQASDYEKEDLLNRDNIRVYQFDVQENYKTKIQQLSCGDYGFEAMTFYDTLEKMSNEIDQIKAGSKNVSRECTKEIGTFGCK